MNVFPEVDENFIDRILDKIKTDFDFFVKVAFEIEFYFKNGNKDKIDNLLALFLFECKKNNVEIASMSEEVGEKQYEVATKPFLEFRRAIKDLFFIKETLLKISESAGIEVIFDAKPFADQPASGLHTHISLHDELDRNFYEKNGEEESAELLKTIGGLCEIMNESFLFFASRPESYQRYINKENCAYFVNSPCNVSWGGNNRTTAIRIPTSTLFPKSRHIEHRVAGADENPFNILAGILIGVHYGLKNNSEAPYKIYGKAYDKQYGCPKFPESLQEAEEKLRSSEKLKDYL